MFDRWEEEHVTCGGSGMVFSPHRRGEDRLERDRSWLEGSWARAQTPMASWPELPTSETATRLDQLTAREALVVRTLLAACVETCFGWHRLVAAVRDRALRTRFERFAQVCDECAGELRELLWGTTDQHLPALQMKGRSRPWSTAGPQVEPESESSEDAIAEAEERAGQLRSAYEESLVDVAPPLRSVLERHMGRAREVQEELGHLGALCFASRNRAFGAFQSPFGAWNPFFSGEAGVIHSYLTLGSRPPRESNPGVGPCRIPRVRGIIRTSFS